MHSIKEILKILFVVILVNSFFSCANIVSPTGGPKDTAPPIVKRCSPPNYSKNFIESEFEITFNEFIAMSDFSADVIINPFMKEKPEFRIRGKSLITTIKDTLLSNSTYTFFFGNTIKDYNEGNVLENYEYVFTTGNILDSLSIKGVVINSFTHEPQKEIFVVLYDNNNDSVIYKEKPLYVTKTNSQGIYELNNLKFNNYQIFALKDANGNYVLDLPNEEFAFYDSLITPCYYPKKVETDSIKEDSIKKDSIISPIIHCQSVNFFSFIAFDSVQRLIKATTDKPGKISFILKNPVDTLKYKSIKDSLPKNWEITEYNKKRDSIIFWIDTICPDTLKLVLYDKNKIIDTVDLIPKKLKLFTDDNKPNKNKKIENKVTLALSNGQKADFYKQISVIASHPIISVDTSKIKFREYNEKDSIGKGIPIRYLFTDSIIHRHFNIDYKLKEGKNYSLLFLPEAFNDFYGLTNDSLKYSFTSTTTDDYGIMYLKVNYKDTLNPYIIQLLNSNGNVIKENYLLFPQKIKYEFLSPTSYKLRVIQDKNRNHKWDTGNYHLKIQPEKVFYYEPAINIKTNWDADIEWRF